jgi:hypothetical protein
MMQRALDADMTGTIRLRYPIVGAYRPSINSPGLARNAPGVFFKRDNFIVFPALIYSMTQGILPAQAQELPERRGKVPKTTIQISPHAKDYLDKIKEQAGVGTYDQAILFLIRERRKHLPSSFGKLPGIGHFTREEDDSHRIRH